MTLPKKPKLVPDWDLANWEKRTDRCRVCRRRDRKIELAHVIGIRLDNAEAVEQVRDGKLIRVAQINPDRVVPLCGPQQQNGTCHYRLDLGHDLDLWDFLTDREKQQAIADVGLGQALVRCAPLTRDQRTVWNEEGELIEMTDWKQAEIPVDAGREAVTK